MNAPETILAMACDRTYLYPWAIAYTSAARHANTSLDVWFGLASDWQSELSDDDINHVLTLIEMTGAKARTVEVQVETAGLPSSSYISPTAFVKLGLFDLCPLDSRMIWLDADLIARAPWMQLLDGSNGHAASGNHELNPAFEESWPASTTGWYVNTGVVVIEGETWQSSFAGNWQPYLADYSKNNFRYMDQDVLNATIRNRWNLLPDSVNYRPIHSQEWIDPAIVHYSGRYKPWMCTSLQHRLLQGVWRPAFDSYFEAEKLFFNFLEQNAPHKEQHFWVSERRRLRGVFQSRAWLFYLKVLSQGAFHLN